MQMAGEKNHGGSSISVHIFSAWVHAFCFLLNRKPCLRGASFALLQKQKKGGKHAKFTAANNLQKKDLHGQGQNTKMSFQCVLVSVWFFSIAQIGHGTRFLIRHFVSLCSESLKLLLCAQEACEILSWEFRRSCSFCLLFFFSEEMRLVFFYIWIRLSWTPILFHRSLPHAHAHAGTRWLRHTHTAESDTLTRTHNNFLVQTHCWNGDISFSASSTIL